MLNSRKSISLFTFVLLFFAAFLVGSPVFAQTSGGNTPPTGSTTFGVPTKKPDPIEVPPSTNPGTEMCVPETMLPFNGKTSINPDNSNNSINVVTENGEIIQVSLVDASGDLTALMPSSGCGNASSGINIELWRTSTGDTSIFLVSRLENNENNETVIVVSGFMIQE